MPLTADTGEPLLHTGTPGVTDMTFRQVRQLTQAISEGVVGAGDLKVSAPGSMTVAVAAGYAFIAGTVITGPDGQHKYGVPLTAAKTLGTVSAPVGATRRDTVIFRVYDEGDAPGNGGLNLGRVEYLQNASETLTAAAIPANAIELAWVDVPVGAVAITGTMIRDRRKKSRAVTDDTIARLMQLCWAGSDGIAPTDQSCDCTVAGMGSNRATDFDVTTGASALTLSISAGNAWVQNDTDKGLSFVRSTAAQTIAAAAAHATLPRIDRVVLDERGALYTVSGTATSGATLTNLTGAPAKPADVLTLAYLLVPAAFTGPFVTATHVLDNRFFAYRPGRKLGFLSSAADLAGAGDKLGPLTISGNGVNLIDVEAKGLIGIDSVGQVYLNIYDGAGGTGTRFDRAQNTQSAGNLPQTVRPIALGIGPVSGRRSFYANLSNSAGTPTLYGTVSNTSLFWARYV